MNRARTILLLAVALVLAFLVDLLTGASVPGRMAVFALAATFVLVLGSKWLAAAFLQRPIGTRAGEPVDDESETREAADA